ncbi:hypothetical protein LY78DRAFT_662287 [Colletotrichum sublineola]|nr:hypothetical protein LY78DRAFT_662287 [Colletotrichum sublineola]
MNNAAAAGRRRGSTFSRPPGRVFKLIKKYVTIVGLGESTASGWLDVKMLGETELGGGPGEKWFMSAFAYFAGLRRWWVWLWPKSGLLAAD